MKKNNVKNSGGVRSLKKSLGLVNNQELVAMISSVIILLFFIYLDNQAPREKINAWTYIGTITANLIGLVILRKLVKGAPIGWILVFLFSIVPAVLYIILVYFMEKNDETKQEFINSL